MYKMKNQQKELTAPSFQMAGLFTFALRLVLGWTYFSAFWRRLILENKLDPEAAGYIGEKFNHFLPNALGIKPLIEYLVSNPETLWWAMVAFTIVEGIVGLFILFGFMTRLMSIGVFSLAMGILLGSGWIGTTCLDEWQIGVLGIAAGFTLFFTGSGNFSVDNWLLQKYPNLGARKGFQWLASGSLPLSNARMKRIVFVGSMTIFGLTLFTNQYFHGGVWGDLHNLSVKPKLELAEAQINDQTLRFEVFRVEGVDVYGSFLIGIALQAKDGTSLVSLDGEALSQFPVEQIDNAYVAKVKPGAHSLIIPLGAKAELSLYDERFKALSSGTYELVLTDISGAQWKTDVHKH